MRRLVFTYIAILPFLSGCLGSHAGRTILARPAPACSGQWAFATDDLKIVVETLARRKKYAPKIESVVILGDSGQADVPVQVYAGHDELGYHQTVRFRAPRDSEDVQARLIVRHLGKRFRMIVHFSTVYVRDDIRWERTDTTVQPI